MASVKVVLLACTALIALADLRVPVQFFWTAGCPFSNRFIISALNQTFSREGIMDQVMNFQAHAFGNSYFVTWACGGQNGVYNSQVRLCWEKRCGFGVVNRPADCFTGRLINQHGDVEGHINRLYACVKATSQAQRGDDTVFMPFVTCMAHAFMEQLAALVQSEEAFAQKCSAEAGLPWGPINACWKDAPGASAFGGDLLKQEAMLTPVHPYVPWVIVNGQPLKDKLDILQAACNAYTGVKPAGCSGSLALTEPPFTV